MPRPLRIQFPGAFYHSFSRGNDRREIFFTDEDRELFLAALGEACELFSVSVHSYCLMSNHYHLLIETDKPNLSNFMKRLLGVYTLRFNRRHKRSGHLFQGRYKAPLVDKDEYLLQVSRYIHLNPVKAGITDHPEAYPWSSLQYFLSHKRPPKFLKMDLIAGSFPSSRAHLKFVRDGIGKEDPRILRPFGGFIIGSKTFAMNFRDRIKKEHGDFRSKELLEIPMDILQEVLEDEEPDLHAYALWRFGKRSQPEIASLVSKSQSAISHAIKRFDGRLGKERGLKAKVNEVKRALSCFMD